MKPMEEGEYILVLTWKVSTHSQTKVCIVMLEGRKRTLGPLKLYAAVRRLKVDTNTHSKRW